jgi:hypothetical protein
LRGQWQQLKDELAPMLSDDPRFSDVSQQLKTKTFQLRDMLFRRAMDCCFVADCVTPGTETAAGKQWCPYHKNLREMGNDITNRATSATV